MPLGGTGGLHGDGQVVQSANCMFGSHMTIAWDESLARILILRRT